jgi:hypothetical protein
MKPSLLGPCEASRYSSFTNLREGTFSFGRGISRVPRGSASQFHARPRANNNYCA